MPNGKAMAVLGIPLVAAVGVIGAIGFQSAKNYHTVNSSQLRTDRELALVQKFNGTPALEELLRSQGFKIKYFVDDATNLVTAEARANVSKALEYGCETNTFTQSPVCAEYSGIRSAVEAQAKANEPYAWMEGARDASLITATIGSLAILVSFSAISNAFRKVKKW